MHLSDMDMDKQVEANLVAEIAALTPARVGVLRCGTRPLTSDWLKFRHDHALAKDAVHGELSQQFLSLFGESRNAQIIQSSALNRADYIHFPPKGKRAPEASIERLRLHHAGSPPADVQIVISDGLSARAVEENALDVVSILEDGLILEQISFAPLVIATLARVAFGDQIAHARGAKLVINLIGERPGLTSASSMSAYLTYNPGPETISSDRTVVSNIHNGGTPPVEAGAYMIKLVTTILAAKVSGVALQQLA
jgi:ethanolamine ammonia-lyase small subunit